MRGSSAPKTYTVDTESEFRQHLRNISNAAQEIAFSFRNDPSSYSPCTTFSEAHGAFLRTFLSEPDPFKRRTLVVSEQKFVTAFISWAEALIPETASQLRVFTASISGLPDYISTVPQLPRNYSEAETQFVDIDSAFDRLPKDQKQAPELEKLLTLRLRQGALFLARFAVEGLGEFVKKVPAVPDAETRELERLKALINTKKEELPLRKQELQKSQDEERALDREIDSTGNAIREKRNTIEREIEAGKQERERIKGEIEKERARGERLRTAQLEIAAILSGPSEVADS
jgi:hypothetical protein